jgi:hypothetical protein
MAKLGTLGKALALGLMVEVLTGFIAFGIDNIVPQPLGRAVANVTQVPGALIIYAISSTRASGFEEQGAYAMLVPLIQWMLWTGFVYWRLVIQDSKIALSRPGE